MAGGCPKDKLIIGMPTYGRGFTLVDAANDGYYAAASGPSTAGTYTREAGFLAYYEVSREQRDDGLCKGKGEMCKGKGKYVRERGNMEGKREMCKNDNSISLRFKLIVKHYNE